MLYQCPNCGKSDVEKKEIQLRIINSRTMKLVKIQPAMEFNCVLGGWIDTKEVSEFAHIA